MNDTFIDDSQQYTDDGFTDSSNENEETQPGETVVILPNNDEPVATPTPIMVTATPTPFPEQTTFPPEQSAEVTPYPDGSETPPGDSSETGHTIDDIYNLLYERVKALEEQEELAKKEQEQQTEALTEYHTYMADQSRNVLSVSSLIFITLAFLTGILLARIVWRKL